MAHFSTSRDSSVGRAEDCSGIITVILRSLVRIRLAGVFFSFTWIFNLAHFAARYNYRRSTFKPYFLLSFVSLKAAELCRHKTFASRLNVFLVRAGPGNVLEVNPNAVYLLKIPSD